MILMQECYVQYKLCKLPSMNSTLCTRRKLVHYNRPLRLGRKLSSSVARTNTLKPHMHQW